MPNRGTSRRSIRPSRIFDLTFCRDRVNSPSKRYVRRGTREGTNESRPRIFARVNVMQLRGGALLQRSDNVSARQMRSRSKYVNARATSSIRRDEFFALRFRASLRKVSSNKRSRTNEFAESRRSEMKIVYAECHGVKTEVQPGHPL